MVFVDFAGISRIDFAVFLGLSEHDRPDFEGHPYILFRNFQEQV